jgi:hypothetical protein
VRERTAPAQGTSALLLLVTLSLAGCATGAERAATQFLNRYFVEANQEEALPFTRGLATERLKREIEDTRVARAVGGVTTDARRVYYEKVKRTDTSATHCDLVYRLEVASDGASYFHDVGLSLDLEGGRWLVSWFAELDAPAAH